MKATDKPLDMLLDLNKNIYFRKVIAENFLWSKKLNSIFRKNIFKKLFKKSKIATFEKVVFSIFLLKSQ